MPLRLELTLLGGFQAHVTGGPPLAVPTRKAQALLAYLALPPGQAHPRDKLATLLWGGLRDAQARGSLRQALAALRRTLGDAAALRVDGGTVALDASAVTTDVAAFAARAVAASPEALAEAARLYRGELLAGLALPEIGFQEWLLTERERLRELALGALGRLLGHQRGAGALEAAAETAQRLVALDPLQEPAHRALMRLYAQLGRRSAALRQYRHCVAALDRELRAEPEAETKALYQEILRERPARSERDSPVEAPPAPAPRPPAGEAPLVAREAELGSLWRALDLAWTGQGRFVALIGEAGVGKTRLVEELAAEAARRGGRVLAGHCYETEQILPLAPWLDAIRAGRVAEARGVLDALPAPWRAQLARLLPELGPAGSASAGGDALQAFEAIAQLVEGLAAERPLLIALEDCHWADDMSLRLIAFLARRIEGQRLLMLGTAREEAFAGSPALAQVDEELRRTGRLAAIPVRPLSRADTATLAARLAGPGLQPDTLAALQAAVWRASEGNPFVTLETVRALRDHPGAGGELPVPRRVQQLIQGRLEQRSEPARALVAVAAAIGRRFDFALLHEAAGLAELAAADAVEELVRHRVLQEAADGLEFAHERIREVAYAQLLPGRRAAVHAQIGQALEALAARERERSPLAIGLHYRAGLVWDRAHAFLERAGVDAAARGASHESLSCFDQAIDALDHLPANAARNRHRFDLHHRAAYDLYRLGRFEDALERCGVAEPLARVLGDTSLVGFVLVARAYTLATLARYAESIAAGEEALAFAGGAGDRALGVWARLVLMRALFATGDHRRVVELGRGALEALAGVPATETLIAAPLFPAVRARTWLALGLARIGALPDALDLAREAVGLADAVDDRGERAWALHCLARVLMTRGEYAQAVPFLEQALALYDAAPVASAVPRSLAALALARTYLGDAEAGVALLERAIRAAERTRVRYGHSTILVHASVAHLVAGRHADAASAAAAALALSRERGERGEEAWAVFVSAEVAAAAAEPDVAAAADGYARARALADAAAMASLCARCDLALARLYDRAGRRADARAAAARAAEGFAALGIAFWRERALALAGP